MKHTFEGNVILVCVYVDDILLTGTCTYEINKFKKAWINLFDMTHLGNMIYFLWMKILHSEKRIIMHQLKYELESLKRFELMNCKSVVAPTETNHKMDFNVDGEDVDATTFTQLVVSLRYLCDNMPDICYAVGMVSKFMSKPKWSRYQVAVRILRYVKGTLRHGILFLFGV